MTTDLAARPQPGRPAAAPDPVAVAAVNRWRWQHYLAVVGVAFLVWGGWTLIAWLAEGP